LDAVVVDVAQIKAWRREMQEIARLYNVVNGGENEENDRLEVVKYLKKCFNVAELISLVYEIGDLDYENLLGNTLDGKVEALVSYMKRRSRLRELVELCRTMRPEAPWPHIVDFIGPDDF